MFGKSATQLTNLTFLSTNKNCCRLFNIDNKMFTKDVLQTGTYGK